MKIAHFTARELQELRDGCNFTDFESQCFELKAKDISDVALAMNLGVSESTIAVTMRRIRTKITKVQKANTKEIKQADDNSCGRCCGTISHTVQEWMELPDEVSRKNVWYAYTDYRTENNVDVARFKFGDGKTLISQLPFVTAAITDNDIEDWDSQLGNDVLTKPIIITERYVFPADGYIMLEFKSAKDYAKVNICGASGRTLFRFEKPKGIRIHSKEVFVKRGMRCERVSASNGAKVKFTPLG